MIPLLNTILINKWNNLLYIPAKLSSLQINECSKLDIVF